MQRCGLRRRSQLVRSVAVASATTIATGGLRRAETATTGIQLQTRAAPRSVATVWTTIAMALSTRTVDAALHPNDVKSPNRAGRKKSASTCMVEQREKKQMVVEWMERQLQEEKEALAVRSSSVRLGAMRCHHLRAHRRHHRRRHPVERRRSRAQRSSLIGALPAPRRFNMCLRRRLLQTTSFRQATSDRFRYLSSTCRARRLRAPHRVHWPLRAAEDWCSHVHTHLALPSAST